MDVASPRYADDPRIALRKMAATATTEGFDLTFEDLARPQREQAPLPRPEEPGVLRGIAVSAGTVLGPVRTPHSADGARIAPGDILIAHTTDPGWTPLFVNATAVVLEVGGVLQHGAVIAREFGKPCAAGIAGIVKAFSDGDWVEVDGSAGTVRRVE